MSNLHRVKHLSKKQQRKQKPFENGQLTAQEYHRKYAYEGDDTARCMCGSKKVSMMCLSFAPLEEMHKMDPRELARILLQESAETIEHLMIEFKQGPFVRVGTRYACLMHQHDLEIAAARLPSWMVVEFDRGPDAPRIVLAPNTDLILNPC